MKRIFSITAVLFLALLIMVACGHSAPTPTSTPIPPTDTPTPPPRPTPTPVAQAQTDESANAEPMKPYYEALEALSAYTATLVMEYTPAAGSDASPFRVVFTELRRRGDPPMQKVRIRGLSSVDPANTRNDATYVFIGDETWFVAGTDRFYTTHATERRLYLSPEDMIPATTQLEPKGPYPEQVNGLDVDYFVIPDGKAIFGDGPNAPTNAELLQGDVWVARDGNFITRYIIRARADDLKLRREPTPGTLSIVYNVRPLRPEEVQIVPPENALTLEETAMKGFQPGEFPVPEGAQPETLVNTDKQQLISVIVPHTTVTDTFSFYAEALQNLGWSEIQDDHHGDATSVYSSWEKDGDTVMLSIRALRTEDGVQVVAQNGPSQATK